MWFANRQQLVSRVLASAACVAIFASVGCAGKSLGFRDRGLKLAEQEAAPAAESVAPTTTQKAAVVSLDTLGGPTATQPTVQQTAATVPTPKTGAPVAPKRSTGLRNFASIFEAEPSTTESMSDPFLSDPNRPPASAFTNNTAPAKRAVQTAQAPTSQKPSSRTKLANDFDASMAALAKDVESPKSKTAPKADASANPFAEFATARETQAKPQDDLAQRQADELKAKLARLEQEQKAKTSAKPSNPFADLDQKPAVAKVDLPGKPTSTPKKESRKDWIQTAASSLPMPSSPLGVSEPKETVQETKSATAASVQAAARERVRNLLDAAEIALRGERYESAESIASRAYDVVQTEQLTFQPGERTPSAMLRRIQSERRLAGSAESSVEVAEVPAPATTVAPAIPKNAFGDFPKVTVWEAVTDDADFVTPTTTEAESGWASLDAPTMTSDDDFIPGPPSEDLSTDTGSEWATPSSSYDVTQEQTEFQTTAFTVSPSWDAETKSLPAPPRAEPSFDDVPAWAAETPTAPSYDEDRFGVSSFAPEQDTTPWADSSATLPALPKLPTFEEQRQNPFETVDERPFTGDQVAMATTEIAPPPPMILDAPATSPASANYGTILALLIVIGLGLVAVLAFKTGPQSA